MKRLYHQIFCHNIKIHSVKAHNSLSHLCTYILLLSLEKTLHKYSLEVAEKSVEMTCMEMPAEKKCVMALQAKCSASSTR